MPYIKQATRSGSIWCDWGGGFFDGWYPTSKTRRGRVTKHGQICPTITASNQEVYRLIEHNGSQYAIRKLTPKECWRLMGWDDESFAKAETVCSNTQLYKQAGNGIVCQVIEAIARANFGDIATPIYLTELFGGIGCQAKGFQYAEVPFVHHRYVDFDKYATASYNAIWGTDHTPTDITTVCGEDLGFDMEHDHLTCYSFPCTDLSCAGRMAGMSRNSGTRSGLLWEVERILKECDVLPKYLLMENVPQVHGKKNLADFEEWCEFLNSLGYYSEWADLNAKDFGIAQNRNRTFMLSVLHGHEGDIKWPDPIPLTTCMADYLDDEVEDKYYINNERADQLIRNLIDEGRLDDSVCK